MIVKRIKFCITEKDTNMFHGQSLAKLGINPRYRAKNPSVLMV